MLIKLSPTKYYKLRITSYGNKINFHLLLRGKSLNKLAIVALTFSVDYYLLGVYSLVNSENIFLAILVL